MGDPIHHRVIVIPYLPDPLHIRPFLCSFLDFRSIGIFCVSYLLHIASNYDLLLANDNSSRRIRRR